MKEQFSPEIIRDFKKFTHDENTLGELEYTSNYGSNP